MQSPSAADLLVLLLFVLLVLDSRRLRALTSGRGRRDLGAGTGIPAGSASDKVGLSLGRIQLRQFVDGDDGGARWPDLEVLPVVDGDDATADPGTPDEPGAILPVPGGGPFNTLPAARHCGDRPTVVLDWCLANDLARRPIAALEAAQGPARPAQEVLPTAPG